MKIMRESRVRFSVFVLLAASLGVTGIASSTPPEESDSRETQRDADAERRKVGEKLVRKALEGGDEDIMSALIRLMNESARKLQVEFDAGPDTRAVQEEVMEKLDHAIKIAAAQRRKGKPKPRPQEEADKRRMEQKAERQKSKEDEGGSAQAEAAKPGEATGQADPIEGELGGRSEGEAGRSWGHLPPRDREEVIQGIDEAYLERYRRWIERYYRALQEVDE